jgi:hypothetical protein
MTAELRIRAYIRTRRCVVCAEQLGRMCRSRICAACDEHWRFCRRCQGPEPRTARCPAARPCPRPGCLNDVTDKRRRLCADCLARYKYCACCGEVKPHAEFSAHAGEPTGLTAYCAVCDALRRERKHPQRPVIRNSERLANADVCGRQINRLLATGMAWKDVAEATGLNIHVAQQRWYGWCRRQRSKS